MLEDAAFDDGKGTVCDVVVATAAGLVDRLKAGILRSRLLFCEYVGHETCPVYAKYDQIWKEGMGV